MQGTPKVTFIHDGARLHYALPVGIQRAGMLERLFADFYMRGPLERAVARLLGFAKPALGQKLRGRVASELDPRKVLTNPWLVLKLTAHGRGHSAQEGYEWYSRQMANWVSRKGFGAANVLMGFVRNIHPDLCAKARGEGLAIVADQIIAPAVEEERESGLQRKRFGGWEDETPDEYAAIARFEAATWRSVDQWTCASSYVKEGLIAQGIPAARISVLPYPIDTTELASVNRQPRREQIIVGYVGSVGLRKGAPYFFEVARRLASERVRFVMLGPIQLRHDAVQKHRGPAELIGAVPRSEVVRWLEKFDLVLFPTTCEGSAGSLMEAMASGLPVVTSRNSGTVARDGVEGFITDYDDIDAMSERVGRLIEDAELRLRMGEAARRRAAEFNIDWYSREISQVLRKARPGQTEEAGPALAMSRPTP